MAEITDRSTIFGVLLLLALSALVAILAISQTADSKKTPLQSLLSDESCTKACWRGIEVGVTERDAVTRMLDDAEIDVHVIEGIGNEGHAVYEWELPADWTIVDDGEDAGYAVMTFREGIVSYVLLPVDVCVSTVISEYGVPAKVNAVTDDIELIYPDHGVIFYVSANVRTLNRVSAVFLETDEGISELLDNPYLQDWSEIADEFSGECEDSLTR